MRYAELRETIEKYIFEVNEMIDNPNYPLDELVEVINQLKGYENCLRHIKKSLNQNARTYTSEFSFNRRLWNIIYDDIRWTIESYEKRKKREI